jgi:acetyltransferase-like isoleucine patch superfamily enzyme
MEHREVSSKADQGALSSFSLAGELDAALSQTQLSNNQANCESDSNNDQASSTSVETMAMTPESALIADATQLRLRIFNSTTLCTSAVSVFPTTSPSPPFPITLEYAHMVLSQPFKVSRCSTLQALKLNARVKCTHYNAAAITDSTLVQDNSRSNFTVDNLAATLREHREAQRQQLLDLFGFVEPQPDGDETTRLRAPAIDPPFGVFIGVNTRVGQEFYANAGVRIHDHAPVVIGRHVRLGPNVSLLTEGHDTDAERRRSGDVFAAPIEIGDDVWIGAGATVLGGVRIGDGAVVGAGTLVCKDVGAGEVVVGVPAKVVRKKRGAGNDEAVGFERRKDGTGDGVVLGAVGAGMV